MRQLLLSSMNEVRKPQFVFKQFLYHHCSFFLFYIYFLMNHILRKPSFAKIFRFVFTKNSIQIYRRVFAISSTKNILMHINIIHLKIYFETLKIPSPIKKVQVQVQLYYSLSINLSNQYDKQAIHTSYTGNFMSVHY